MCISFLHRSFCLVLISAACTLTIHAQYLRLFNLNSSSYPLVRANFYAAVKTGAQITQLSIPDFTVAENGSTRTVTLVSCPQKYPSPAVSLAISIDKSSSMNWSSNSGPSFVPLKYVKYTAHDLCSQFTLPPSEIAVQECDDTPLLIRDFSTNTTLIHLAIDTITIGSQNNFFNQLIGTTSGLLNIAKAGKNRRVAVLFTDAWWSALDDTQLRMCIDTCLKYDIRFYAAIYSRAEAQPNGITASMKTLALMTGGIVIDDIVNEDAAHAIANQLFFNINQQGPCVIEWMSAPDCSVNRNVEIQCLPNSANAATEYSAPTSALRIESASPSSVRFTKVVPGDFRDTTVVITAGNSTMNVTNISSDNPLFTVTPTSFALKPGANKSVTIRFSPVDSGMTYALFDVVSDGCPLGFSATGGFIGKKATAHPPPSLVLTHPNGGEVFVVGSDTIVTWKGVPATEPVQLELSIDSGSSWRPLTESGVGHKWNWDNIPKPTSDKCLARVRQVAVDPRYSRYDRVWSGQTLDYLKGVSPDGVLMAFTNGNSILIVEAKTKIIFAELVGHKGYVNSVTWSNDGSLLASTSADSTIKIWNCNTWDLSATLRGHTANVYAAVFSPDASMIASASEDKTVKTWNVSKATLISSFKDLYAAATNVEWDATGKQLLGAGTNYSVASWDIKNATLINITYIGGPFGSYLFDAKWSPDRQVIAVSQHDSLVRLYNPINAKLISILSGSNVDVYSVSWSPDGRYIAGFCPFVGVRIWDALSGALLQELKGLPAFMTSMDWSRDSKRITCGGDNKVAITWDATTGKEVERFSILTKGLTCSDWSPDGNYIATGTLENSVLIWNALTGALINTLTGHRGIINDVSWSADSRYVVSSSRDSTARVWHPFTSTLVATLIPKTNPNDLIAAQWSPDGKAIATLNANTNIDLWQTSNWSLTKTITSSAHSLKWFGDSKSLLTANLQTKVMLKPPTFVLFYSYSIIDAATSKETKLIADSAKYITCLDISGDGEYAFLGFGDDTIRVYSLSKKILVRSIPMHIPHRNQSVTSLAVGPDGTYLAACSGDSTINIFSTGTGSLIRSLKNPGSALSSLCWSPDGDYLSTTHSKSRMMTDVWLIQPPVLQQDSSDAVFKIVAPEPASQDVDMGRALVGAEKDSTVLLFIRNTGNYPYTVKSLVISGANASEFLNISSAPPYVIPALGGYDVEFAFRPKSTGVKNADIIIDYGADTLRQHITGLGAQPALALGATVIDFGRVKVGERRDTVVTSTIRNIGNDWVYLVDATHIGPNATDFTTLNSNLPVTIGPGDSLPMSLRFTPSEIGRTNGRIAVNFNNIGTPLFIFLMGEGISPGPQIIATIGTIPSLLCSGSSIDSLRITNRGSDTLVIDSITITGANPGEFSVLSPLAGMQILSGETRTVAVQYRPLNVGASSAELKIFSNSVSDSMLRVTLTARKDSVNFSMNRMSDILVDVCPGETRSLKLALTNMGSVADVLLLNSDSALTLSANRYALAAGLSDTMTITYTAPVNDTTITQTFRILDSLCNRELHYTLTVNINTPGISTNDVSIATTLNSTASANLFLHNTGKRDVLITTFSTASPFVLSGLNLPLLLHSDDSTTVLVSYTAFDTAIHQVSLKIDADPCGATCMSIITGSAQPASAVLAILSASASVGDTVHIPVVLRREQNIALSSVTGYRAQLRFNQSMLYPVGTTAIGSVIGSSRILDLDLPQGSVGDTLLTLSFVSTLGNDTVTALTLEDAEASGGVATITTESGNFNLLNICRADGARLLNTEGSTSIVSIGPNPAQDQIALTLSTHESGEIKVYLCNVLGERVVSAWMGRHGTGTWDLTIPIERVGNGVYYVVLETQTVRRVKEIQVMR